MDITVAFYYLTQYSRNSTWDANGTRLGGSVSPKIQGSSEFLNRQSSSFALQFKISRTIIFKELKQLDLLQGVVILTQDCRVQLFFAELFLILQGLF